MKLEGHAILVPPAEEAIEALALERRPRERQGTPLSDDELRSAAAELLGMRQRLIDREREDPYRFGWEPTIWKVCDALIDFPWCDDGFVEVLCKRFDWARRLREEKGQESPGAASGQTAAEAVWEAFKLRMRKALGFSRPVTMLLILGGNRTGKSNYAAKRAQMMLSRRARSRVTAFHMSNDRSVEEQQPLFWHYMPRDFRTQRKGQVEYVAYKEKVGFSEGSFVNRIGSRCSFKNYEQDRTTAIEGKADDLMLPDELAPVDWLETMLYRLTDRGGHAIPTFTPVEGYSLAVKWFLDGAVTVRECEAPLLPKDGLPADVARALGLSEEEYQELLAAKERKGSPPAFAPESRPEDCLEWIDPPSPEGDGVASPGGGLGRDGGGEGGGEGEKEWLMVDGKWGTGIDGIRRDGGGEGGKEWVMGDGGWGRGVDGIRRDGGRDGEKRIFERVPRVARPVNEKLGVVFFHCRDNPFGNPKEVAATALEKRQAAEVRVRCYGVAEKSFSNVLVRFSRSVHVIPDSGVPKEGTNFQIIDPAGDRNFFMGWIRKTKDAFFVYREWPGNYEIPRQGVPGPWAIPSARLKGRNDGDRGEGQRSFGFGLLDYKLELARLEQWKDFLKWAAGKGADAEGDGLEWVANEVATGRLRPEDEEIEEWEDFSEGERMEVRIVDARAASTSRVERARPVTLLDELQDLGLNVVLAPGGAVIGDVQKGDGIQPVVSALAWNRDERQSFTNRPRLYVAESCRNTIFAMETWMNVEGQKGATKDPIDVLRMFFGSEYAGLEDAPPAQKGFFYGRGAGSGKMYRPGERKLAKWVSRRAVR